ncbi:MAG: Sec-independent protein translocase protein TatB [Proteobacteria bacterium]|nr:Sec-independent protein translocase protein TatB [Pseudomonadota bacterium]
MLDIGWTEIMVIAIVMIVVVGPKDLPPMLRAFGKMTANLRRMAGDFRHQFDEALREADMDDVRKTIADAKSLNPGSAIRDALNPLRQMGEEIRSDLQKVTVPATPAASASALPPVVEAPAETPEPLPASPVIPVSAPTPAPAAVSPAPVPAQVAVAAEAEKPKRARKATPAKGDKTASDKPAPKRTRKAEKPVEMAEAPVKKASAPRKKKTDTGKGEA